MGRAHYRPDGTRRRTSGELAARAKKKAQREAQAAAAAAAALSGEAEQDAGANDVHLAAPVEEAEPDFVWPDRRGDDDEEQEEVEIEVEVEAEEEEPQVRRRPQVKLRPAPKWGAAALAELAHDLHIARRSAQIGFFAFQRR